MADVGEKRPPQITVGLAPSVVSLIRAVMELVTLASPPASTGVGAVPPVLDAPVSRTISHRIGVFVAVVPSNVKSTPMILQVLVAVEAIWTATFKAAEAHATLPELTVKMAAISEPGAGRFAHISSRTDSSHRALDSPPAASPQLSVCQDDVAGHHQLGASLNLLHQYGRESGMPAQLRR